MAMTNSEVISALNDLIETCKDGEYGFKTAAACVESADLRTLFNSYSEQRAKFASDLQAEVRRLGGTPGEGGSLTGLIHRGWMNLQAAVRSEDECAVITECESGEDAALKTYEEVLRQDLPVSVALMVQTHYSRIKEAHDRIRQLEIATARCG
jgi:uncharacterized protein (TIGR02284 family)